MNPLRTSILHGPYPLRRRLRWAVRDCMIIVLNALRGFGW